MAKALGAEVDYADVDRERLGIAEKLGARALGITNARPVILELLALVAKGALDPAPVTTLLAPWADADRAFLEKTTKVVVSRVP